MMDVRLAEKALRTAERTGADEVEVVMESSHDVEIILKRNEIHSEKDCRTAALGIRTVVDKKHSFTSCNLPHPDIESLAQHGVFLAKKNVSDPYWIHLPLKSTPAHVEDIYSPVLAELSYDALFEFAQELLAGAQMVRNVDVEEGHIHISDETFYITNSHSVSGSYEATTCEVDLVCTAKYSGHSECMAYDYFYSKTPDFDLMEFAQAVAQSAHRGLGAKALPHPLEGPVLLMPDPVSQVLFTPLASAVNAETYLWDTSPLSGVIGSRVAPEMVTVTDDGTLKGGYGSRPIDGEGNATAQTPIIQEGIFTGLLHSEYTSNLAGCASSGNAMRTATSDVTVGPTNFMVHPGTASLEELLAELGTGVMVERFSGSVDVTTGLFSGACRQAHYVKNGEICYPVKELTLSGNAFQALQKIELLGDSAIPEYQGIMAPACLVGGISITP
jgi:PmbA protein